VSPRPRNPDAHQALLEACRTEFGRRGLEGARVEDIARRAGLAKGSFYLHFRSKEDAFRLMLQRFLGALEEQAMRRHEEEAELERREGPLRAGDVARGSERFRRWLEAECAWDTEMLEVCWRNRHVIAAVDGAGGRTSRMMRDFRRRMSALVAGNFLAQQAAGRLRPGVDLSAVADAIVGGYEAFARRMADLPQKPDLAAWARTFLLLFHQGVFDLSAGEAPRRRAGGD